MEKKSNVEEASWVLRRVSSCTAMTEAREEFFRAETVSLPRAGTMVRMAWGAMMRRMRTRGVMPRAWAASDLAGVDAEDAGPQDLGDEGRLVGGHGEARRRRGRSSVRPMWGRAS